jgi:FkbM family methyltransferase
VLPYLQRTVKESAYRERWTLVPKAVSVQSGKVTFTLSDQTNSVYDSIRPTNRAASVKQVEVEMTTVDETWRALGSPSVSVIKCDVEGAELDVLRGALECLRTERPTILLEWNATNLAAYGCAHGSLLDFAREEKCKLFSVPRLVELHSVQELDLHMMLTESFLLVPAGSD